MNLRLAVQPRGLSVCILVAVAILAATESKPDEPNKAWPSSLRKSIGKDWTVELQEQQVPPNRGNVLISVGHDRRSTLYRSTVRTEPVRAESETALTKEQCEKLLDLAVQAREAIAFDFPLQGIFDSANVSLRVKSGRRQIELELQGACCETNVALLSRLQDLADIASPRTMTMVNEVWHAKRDGRYAYAERTPRGVIDGWRAKSNISRAGSDQVWGEWKIELAAANDAQQRMRFVLHMDGAVEIGEAAAKTGKEGSDTARDTTRTPPSSNVLEPGDCEKVLELALKALTEFNFEHDAAPRDGGMQVSLKLSSGLWKYPCGRALRVQETGVRRDEVGRSFLAPIIEFVNTKLPESKRLSFE